MKPTSFSIVLAFLFQATTLAAEIGSGTIAFDPARTYSVGHVPEVFALGDLDGDGLLDLVVANTSADGMPGGDSISILMGVLNGTFSSEGKLPIAVEKRPEGLALARIDSDDRLDVVTSNFSGNSVSILLGDGAGQFTPLPPIPVPGGPRFVIALDFDGDGFTDLATSNYNSDTVSILQGNGEGAFRLSSPILVGNGPEVIAAGHFDEDGFLDLVTSNALDDTVTLLLGDGNGAFSAAATHPVGQLPRFVMARDLNGDGLDDLLVANNGSNNVTVEENMGSLSFRTAASLSFSSPTLSFQKPVYLDLADVDGDGLSDILVTWAGSKVFTVFPRGRSAFEFGAPSVIQTGNTPLGIQAVDIDGDADLDIMVTNAKDDTVSVYRSYLKDPGVIVDTDAEGTEAVGPWTPSKTPFAFGPSSLFSKNGSRYSWQASLPVPGQYEVLMWWTVTPNRSAAVPVEIQHQDGSSSLLVNQKENIGVWHSLGTYTFGTKGTVILTCPVDDKSVSADAVRFRSSMSQGATAGMIPVVARERPEDISVGERTVLALQGNLSIHASSEALNLVAAVVRAVGAGNESERIEECRLYIDSNHNGVFDSTDRQLGAPLRFDFFDFRAITFQGFEETLPSGSSTDFFLVSKVLPLALSSGERKGTPLALAAAAMTGVGVLLLQRRKREKLFKLPLALALVAMLALSSASGCGDDRRGGKAGAGPVGGGGNGGGFSGDLQLELSSLVTLGKETGSPSVVVGLPLSGWSF